MAEINEGVKKIIESNALALATVDENGNPHCIAVGDVKVVSKNNILIGDNYMKNTIKNIAKNNRVSLVVWIRNWEEHCIGYELTGEAEYFTTGMWHDMIKKIHKGFPAKGAILVKINKIRVLS